MSATQPEAISAPARMKSIQVQAPGNIDDMKLVEVPTPTAGPKQALVHLAASGVNFIDIGFRSAAAKSDTPINLGMEGAGTVVAVGDGVHEVACGDRVAYVMTRGSYAEYAVVPASQLVKIPDQVGFNVAASVLLQGMTAHYLTQSTYPLKKGETCLVHAAAGAVGGLIVQMAIMAGARVFATASTPDKAQAAIAAGADEAIVYTEKDFEAEVKRLTNGRGVDVVYDSLGKTTFDKSLNCVRPRGTVVLFGQTSGPVTPVDPGLLSSKGSLFLTRPTLPHYIATREELLSRAGDVFQWILAGKLKPRIDSQYHLADAAAAHRRFESRNARGKLVLTVP